MRAAPQAAPALFRLLSDSAVMRAALAACGAPLALADALAPGHPLTYANPAFDALFGYRRDEAIGQPLEALIPDEDDLRRVLAQAPARGLSAARRGDGTLLHVEFTVGPVRSGDRLTHWVLAFSDCSELQSLRAELGALRAEAAR